MAHAETPDESWAGQDKVKHFGLSAAAAATAVAATQAMAPSYNNFLTHFSLGMVPGLMREIGQSNPSAQDLTWNALGAATGAYLGGKVFIHPMGADQGLRLNGLRVIFHATFD